MICVRCNYNPAHNPTHGQFYVLAAFAERKDKYGTAGVPLCVCPVCGNVQGDLSHQTSFMDY